MPGFPEVSIRWIEPSNSRMGASANAEFRVYGSGLRVQSLGFRVQGLEFRVYGVGFRVQGFRV